MAEQDDNKKPSENFLRWLTKEAIRREPATRFVLVLAPIALIVAPLTGLFADVGAAMAWMGTTLLLTFLVPLLVYVSKDRGVLKYPAHVVVWIGVIYIAVMAFTSIADAAAKTDWSAIAALTAVGGTEVDTATEQAKVDPIQVPDADELPAPIDTPPPVAAGNAAFNQCVGRIEAESGGDPDAALTLARSCLK